MSIPSCTNWFHVYSSVGVQLSALIIWHKDFNGYCERNIVFQSPWFWITSIGICPEIPYQSTPTHVTLPCEDAVNWPEQQLLTTWSPRSFWLLKSISSFFYCIHWVILMHQTFLRAILSKHHHGCLRMDVHGT